jgi:hypothetical protein
VLHIILGGRYKPAGLESMAEETKFTKAEVKFMYRAFKTECPNGIIDEDTFKVRKLVTHELFILWCKNYGAEV